MRELAQALDRDGATVVYLRVLLSLSSSSWGDGNPFQGLILKFQDRETARSVSVTPSRHDAQWLTLKRLISR